MLYVVQAIAEGQLSKLAAHDELKHAQSKGDAFSDWQEGPLSFPPTYKFVRGTHRWVV